MSSPESVTKLFTQAGFLPPRAVADPASTGGAGGGLHLVTALPYWTDEEPDDSAPGDPHGLIAPFARRNYYKEAVKRLKGVASILIAQTGGSRKEVRLFANSPLPEKELALRAGLGFQGRNTLIIIPGRGSLFILAGIHFAAPPEKWRDTMLRNQGPPELPPDPCGSCRACREACPAGALETPGQLDRSRCLQALATEYRLLPPAVMEAWGTRIYGCQVCQDVCPYNRDLPAGVDIDRGLLGPSLALRPLLSAAAPLLEERETEENRGRAVKKALFRGTCLDQGWIDGRALIRNALLAAGNSGDGSAAPLLRLYSKKRDPILAQTAAWSLERLRKGKRAAK